MARADLKQRFGARIRSLRESRGKTQEQLADSAKIGRKYISDIECGRRNIALTNVQLLAKALKVKMFELMPDWPLG